jgi:hypothetical protein
VAVHVHATAIRDIAVNPKFQGSRKKADRHQRIDECVLVDALNLNGLVRAVRHL